jgi:hypothetical protein
MPERRSETGFFWIAIFILSIALVVIITFGFDAFNLALMPR